MSISTKYILLSILKLLKQSILIKSLISTELKGESPGESPTLTGESPAASAGELESSAWSTEECLEYRVGVEF